MTTIQHPDNGPDREQAAALLAHAESRRREVAHFSPAFGAYAVLCTSSGLGILLLSYTTGQQRLAGLIALLAFFVVAAFLPLLMRSPSAARGFGRRWIVFIGIWAALWGVAMVVTSAVRNGTNETLQVVVPVLCSVAFLVLMVIATAREAERVKQERRSRTAPEAGA